MSKTKSKREYVVGYAGECECVYGPSQHMWCDKMTKRGAIAIAGLLLSPDVDVCIYRLVPVATGRAVNGKFVERKKAKKKPARRKSVNGPRIVLAPDGYSEIRTSTHRWLNGSRTWVNRDRVSDQYGYGTRTECRSELPAARAAWRKMKAGKGGRKA